LIYLTTSSPDLHYVVGLIFRFLQKPKEAHWKVAKRILRYVKGTLHYGLQFEKVVDFGLLGFFDSNWVGCQDERKSTTGYTFSMGSVVI